MADNMAQSQLMKPITTAVVINDDLYMDNSSLTMICASLNQARLVGRSFLAMEIHYPEAGTEKVKEFMTKLITGLRDEGHETVAVSFEHIATGDERDYYRVTISVKSLR